VTCQEGVGPKSDPHPAGQMLIAAIVSQRIIAIVTQLLKTFGLYDDDL